MNLAFPAVIKDIRISPDGILATLDISPEDVTPLSDLIDKMITVSVTPTPSTAPPAARPEPPLPFEPDGDTDVRSSHSGHDVPLQRDADAPPDDPPAPKKRTSSGRKRAE